MSQTWSARPARPPARQGRRPSPLPAHNTPRTGRNPSTSRQELEQICLDLFTHQGFEATSIEDIAAAAGIGRRTFFRYFPSKNDPVWGDFDQALGELEAWLLRCPDDVPLMTAIRRGVVAFNTYDPANEQSHRNRMSLILNTNAPQTHSTLRYGEWRQIVARFAAHRMGCGPDDLLPRVIGHLVLGASLAAYEQWLAEVGSDLLTHLEKALSVLDDSSVLQVGGAHR
jgi:mycofactocin system transcriptional regulator